MLTSSLDIQKLILLKWTKLSPDQKKRLKLDTLVPTVFIIILNIKDKFVWIIMDSMLSLFSLQDLEKPDLDNLGFWLFTELSILEWVLN